MLWIFDNAFIIDGGVVEAEQFHEAPKLFGIRLIRIIIICYKVLEVFANFIGLIRALFLNSIMLFHYLTILILEVINRPCVLLRVVIAVPSDGRSNQLCIHNWIGLINDDPRFAHSLHAELYVELLAVGVLRVDWPQYPRRVLGVAKLVAAIGPDEPLIAALLHFHVLCHELFNAFADSDTLYGELELYLSAVRLLKIRLNEGPLVNALSLEILAYQIVLSYIQPELKPVFGLHFFVLVEIRVNDGKNHFIANAVIQ